MGEQGPSGSEHLVLQQEITSLIHSTTPTLEGGVRLKPSGKELTVQEIKDKLPLEADGEKTNVPDYIKTHLADILKPEDINALRLDTSQPLSATEQQKIARYFLQSTPQRLLEVKNALPALQSDIHHFPEIIASLQVIGIEALQQQYAKDTQSDTTHNAYTPIDETFGLGSRRKVYTEMERFADETTLAGDSMKTFGKTNEGTPMLHSTVEMDLRLAQSLFNAALPPEKVIEVTKLQLQIQETSDPSEKTKLAHDLTLLRQKLYKGILVAYNVQPEKGIIAVLPSEKAEIEELAKQIRARMNTVEREGQKLNGMDIEKANTVALEKTLTALNIPITATLLDQRLEEAKMSFHAGEKLQTVTADFFADPAFATVPAKTKKIAQQILENRIRTSRSIAGIDDYYKKQGGLKPENLTFFTYLPMGLKGTELLYRRTLSEEELKEEAPQPAPEIPDWLNPKIPILQLEQKEEVKEDETAIQTTGISDQESSLSNHPLSTYKKGGFREDVQQVLQRGEDWESVKKGEPIPRRKKRGTEEPRPPGREKQDKRRVPSPKEALWERQQATSPQTSPPEVTEGMEIHHATVPWIKGVVVEKTQEEKNIPGYKVRDRGGNTYFIAESDAQVTPLAIKSEKAEEAFDKLLTMWKQIDKDRQLVEQKGPYFEERSAAQKKRLERLLQEELEAEASEDEIIALRTEEEERIKQIIEQAQHRYAAATQRIGESSVKEDLEAELRRLDPQRAEKAFQEDVHFIIQQAGSPTTTATDDQPTQQATTELESRAAGEAKEKQLPIYQGTQRKSDVLNNGSDGQEYAVPFAFRLGKQYLTLPLIADVKDPTHIRILDDMHNPEAKNAYMLKQRRSSLYIRKGGGKRTKIPTENLSEQPFVVALNDQVAVEVRGFNPQTREVILHKIPSSKELFEQQQTMFAQTTPPEPSSTLPPEQGKTAAVVTSISAEPAQQPTVAQTDEATINTSNLLPELNVPPFLLPRRWNILSREVRLAAAQAIGLPDEVADSAWEQLSLVQQNAILEERAKIAGETKL